MFLSRVTLLVSVGSLMVLLEAQGRLDRRESLALLVMTVRQVPLALKGIRVQQDLKEILGLQEIRVRQVLLVLRALKEMMVLKVRQVPLALKAIRGLLARRDQMVSRVQQDWLV